MSAVSDDEYYLSPYENDDEVSSHFNPNTVLKQIDEVRIQILRGFSGYPNTHNILKGQELLFHIHSLERFVLAQVGEQSMVT
jgi:hypothetical protein